MTNRSRGYRSLPGLLAALLLLLLPAAGVWGADINQLRLQQQKDLKTLEQNYSAKVRNNPNLVKPDGTIDTDHADYRQILNDYSSEKAGVQARYQQQDGRSSDLNDLQKRYGSSVKTTGSAPRDVRADVDISTNDRNTATRIAREWKERGDKIRYDKKNGVWINESQDISLWHPPTEKQLENRKNYHDAFSTPGGKQATNVKGHEAIRDPEGYVLDNEKKFIHSVEDIESSDINSSDPKRQLDRDMALKTAGKSVSKSAQQVDHRSDVTRQADKLRNYGDKFEAGITPLGATPEQQQADERKWIAKADQTVQNTKPAAQAQSQKSREVRKQLAKNVRERGGKGPSSNTAETAGNIDARNRTLDRENEKARQANADARKRAGLADAPTPDKSEVKRQAESSAQRQTEKAKKGPLFANTRKGSSKNSTWRTDETRVGDRSAKRQRSTTENADGSTTRRDTKTVTQRNADGSRRTTQQRTVVQTNADGSSRSRHQQSSEAGGSKTIHTTDNERDSSGRTTSITNTTSTSRQRPGGAESSSETSSTTTRNADGGSSDVTRRSEGYQGKRGGSQTTRTTQVDHDAGGRQTRVTETNSSSSSRNTGNGTTTSTTTRSTSTGDANSWLPQSVRGPTTTTTTGHSIETDSGDVKTTTSASTTTQTDDWGGRKITTTTRSEGQSTTTTHDDGRKTTTNVDTGTKTTPWSKTRTTTGGISHDLKPGGDPNEPEPGKGLADPTKVNVKIAGGKLFDDVDNAKGTVATSTAGRTEDGTEYAGDAKVQVGQTGATGGWEVTANQRGLHGKVNVNTEANLVKATVNASVQKKVAGTDLEAKTSTTGTVGAEGGGSVEAHLGKDRVAGGAEVKVFVGAKVKSALELSAKRWGVKLTGKLQGELSAGAGGEAKVEGELSWTRIKINSKVAATVGLGAGGGGDVEIDIHEAITGYDRAALDQQFAAGDGIVQICRAIRSGRLQLPPGKKFSDIRELLQQKAEIYAAHPQLSRDGKQISLIDSLIRDLGLVKGKGGAYITAHHKQKDWYCTNKPQISSKMSVPSIVSSRR